jgi:hypothetical protein
MLLGYQTERVNETIRVIPTSQQDSDAGFSANANEDTLLGPVCDRTRHGGGAQFNQGREMAQLSERYNVCGV